MLSARIPAFRKEVFPLNILIIDDLFVPEPAKADSSEKVLLCGFAKENERRRKLLFFLAGIFTKSWLTPSLSEYSKEGGVSVLQRKSLASKTFAPSF